VDQPRGFDLIPEREDGWWDLSDSDDDDGDADTRLPTRADAETALGDYLLSKVMQGRMPASEACTIAYYAKFCGVGGVTDAIALKPSSPSGHFQRQIDSVIGADILDKRFAWLDVPGYSKTQMGRVVHSVLALPAHEVLLAELARTPDAEYRLGEKVRDRELPPSYFTHPVAVRSNFTAMPLAFYVDGVPFAKHDGIVGFWVYSLVTTTRHLFAVVRKSRVCRCGCRGWCTYYHFFVFFQWSLLAMAAGEHPRRRWDGKDWSEADVAAGRNVSAGVAMPLTFALLLVKGDWAEYCATFGFMNWNYSAAPCMFCKCTASNMYDDLNVSAIDIPWEVVSQDDYDASCTLCEIHVVLAPSAIRELKAQLIYDKRKERGCRGRGLKNDIPSLNLLACDRLEPSPDLPDVAGFDTIEPGKTVIFWRHHADARTRHRNPILDKRTGVGVHSIVIDQLHALNIGVLKDFCKHAIWEMLLTNSFNVPEPTTQAELIDLGCSLFRNALQTWYSSRHVAGEDFTHLEDFCSTMIGTAEHRFLRTKAAETKGLLYFIHYHLSNCAVRMNRADVWEACASALEGLMRAMSDGPMVVSPALRQETWTTREGGR
jgi:hypothetical protein